METSPLISRANLWIGFYMIAASVMKELILLGIMLKNGQTYFKNFAV